MMFSILLPSNVGMILSILLPIANFDVLDPEWTTDYMFTYAEDKHEELEDEITD